MPRSEDPERPLQESKHPEIDVFSACAKQLELLKPEARERVLRALLILFKEDHGT